jgi:hypothetical protein
MRARITGNDDDVCELSPFIPLKTNGKTLSDGKMKKTVPLTFEN